MLAKVITRNARGFGEAVRYIASDRPDQAADPRPEMGTLGFACPLDTAEDRQTASAILDATAAAARRKTGSSPVYHVTIYWQDGEYPTVQQAESACAHVLKTLGFEGCEALWALHIQCDTGRSHVHLIVNRVHPDGHTAKVPRLDWLLLDKAMREIELAQGWKHSPGPYGVVEADAVQQSVCMKEPSVPTPQSQARASRSDALPDPSQESIMQTPQAPEIPPAAPEGETAEFESLSVPDRATAEALGADFEDDVQTEADHG